MCNNGIRNVVCGTDINQWSGHLAISRSCTRTREYLAQIINLRTSDATTERTTSTAVGPATSSCRSLVTKTALVSIVVVIVVVAAAVVVVVIEVIGGCKQTRKTYTYMHISIEISPRGR